MKAIALENEQETYLRVQLADSTQAVIPMSKMQEVLTTACDRITVMPLMPQWVMGLLNQRSQIFWVMDLPQFLGLPPLEVEEQTYNIAIVRVEDRPVGLRVKQVHGVSRFSAEAIQSPIGTLPSQLEPYLRGYVLKQESILLVLDTPAIVQGASQILAHTHR
ncbi:MAG: hypothetical protein N5P05_002100 [Chroococcopsis gigantea SAG 12.99]|jgi:positive phototaxis protein PixI|nr:purine-binding chemotaxis protein CheW [Chlorogloea purpurea SAG 13.99]MDV3000494.1 hypothetical protein [Chroococcopsis gigantea SAG 12.99]